MRFQWEFKPVSLSISRFFSNSFYNHEFLFFPPNYTKFTKFLQKCRVNKNNHSDTKTAHLKFFLVNMKIRVIFFSFRVKHISNNRIVYFAQSPEHTRRKWISGNTNDNKIALHMHPILFTSHIIVRFSWNILCSIFRLPYFFSSHVCVNYSQKKLTAFVACTMPM